MFTNIVGINIDGVISVASSIDEPFDWRDLPNGCVLVWDEAHEHPSFAKKDLLKTFRIDSTIYDEKKEFINNQNISVTQKKLEIDEVNKQYKIDLEKKKEDIRDIGQALLMHGHFGIEIYFITQRVTKLNTDVLGSVTTHYVMRRKFGMDAAKIWEFGEAMTTWSKSTADIALNNWLWRYPKHLYKFYISSENHKVNKSFPLKYLAFALVPIALLGFGLKNAYNTGFFGLFPKQQTASVEQKEPIKMGEGQIIELAKDSPEAIQLEKLQAESLGLTVEQYRDLKDPEKRNKQLAEQQANYDKTYQITYNPADPYNSKVEGQYQATSLPKFSGCVKYNGKYTAYTEQGTKIKDIDPSACKRLIEENDRPYNYFKENQQYVMANQNYPPQNYQQDTQQVPKQVNREEYQANNVNELERKAHGANAQGSFSF